MRKFSDEYFLRCLTNIDKAMEELANCDSSIEYAPHIRKKFEGVVFKINDLKYQTGNNAMMKIDEWYFDKEEQE